MIFFFLFFALLGCEVEKPKMNAPVRSAENVPLPLETEIVVLPDPNSYQVKLKWHSADDAQDWLVKRSDLVNTSVEIFKGQNLQRETLDKAVNPGAKYRYELYGALDSGWRFQGEATAEVPKDFEVKEVATEVPAGISRLFLRNGAKIEAGPAGLRLEVTTILSEGGIIESFPDAMKAPPATRGLDGGDIEIRAKKAEGVITVIASGQNGGDGIPGKDGAHGVDGANGQDCFAIPRVPECGDPYKATYPECSAQWFDCFKQIPETYMGDGKNGGRGGNGEMGGSGGAGGNAPHLKMTIEHASNFVVKPLVRPGSGGLPGRGGKAGPGGAGGRSGIDFHCMCHYRNISGVPGEPGVAGVPGVGGADGKGNTFCLKLGDSVTGDCAN